MSRALYSGSRIAHRIGTSPACAEYLDQSRSELYLMRQMVQGLAPCYPTFLHLVRAQGYAIRDMMPLFAVNQGYHGMSLNLHYMYCIKDDVFDVSRDYDLHMV